MALHWAMVSRNRKNVLNVRMLEAETTMLAELADADGVSVSEWVRNTIRVQHALRFSKPAPKPKRK